MHSLCKVFPFDAFRSADSNLGEHVCKLCCKQLIRYFPRAQGRMLPKLPLHTEVSECNLNIEHEKFRRRSLLSDAAVWFLCASHGWK